MFIIELGIGGFAPPSQNRMLGPPSATMLMLGAKVLFTGIIIIWAYCRSGHLLFCRHSGNCIDWLFVCLLIGVAWWCSYSQPLSCMQDSSTSS